MNNTILTVILCVFLGFNSNFSDSIEFTLDELDSSENLSELLKEMDAKSLYGINEKLLKQGIIKAVVDSLNDDFSEVEFYDGNYFRNYVNGNYKGFGFDMDLIELNGANEYVVSNLLANGNAKKAGLMVGDIIKEIDGIPIKGNSKLYEAALSLTEDDKEKLITVLRDKEELKIQIKKENYIEPPIESKTLSEDIYYIDFNNFSENSYEEFKNEIYIINKFHFEKVIIDLRHNPGGSIQSAVNSASFLTEKRPLAFMKYKNEIKELNPNQTDSKILIPKNISLVILVSSDTASSAELFADILRTYGGAIIVGQNTYGKNISQEIFKYGNAEIRFSTAFFSANKEFNSKKSSISPDYIIEEIYPIPYHDVILEKALELLKK